MFQSTGFQSTGFQTGSADVYPFTPATSTQYVEGLPDRVTILLYQGLANVASFTATPVATTPITAGLQDFNYAFKKPFRPPQFVDFVTIDGIRATTPITSGLQDLDVRFKYPFRPHQFGDLVSIDGIRASTPNTSGLQNFDYAFKKPFRPPQFTDFITLDGIRVAIAGTQDFDYEFKKPFLEHRFSELITINGVIASTPSTFTDILFPTLFTKKAYDQSIITVAPVVTAATVTPTTFADVLYPTLIGKRAPEQSSITLAPVVIAATVTPTTAGLQDFDYRFKVPFRPPQFTDFITIDGILASTPITSGLQDLDLQFKRPYRHHEYSTLAINTTVAAQTPITAGVQDFDRGAYKKPQVHDFATSLIYQIAYITAAGMQDFDRQFIYGVKPALQQVTSVAPTEVAVAATPTEFQFALGYQPPFKYGMAAYKQNFMNSTFGQTLPTPPAVTELHNNPFFAHIGRFMGS